MVRFITGRARQGKTRQVYEEIRTALDRQDGTALLLLVPEQYTLQTEKELVQYLGVSGIIDAEVSSFRRLAQRLAVEEGGRSRVLLDDLGISLVLRKVIEKKRDQLVFFNRAAGQAGFAESLSGTISNFKQQGLSALELGQAVVLLEDNAEKRLLGQKLADIKLLFEGLEQELEDSRIDNDDFINFFIEKIGQSRFLMEYRVWIDGFEGFSMQNMRIIAALASRCKEMSISLTFDSSQRERDRELFWLSQSCLKQLELMLERQGIPFCLFPLSSPDSPVQPAVFGHLEQELFSYPGRVYQGDCGGLELFSAANPAVEVEYAAAKIIELVMEKGCRYRDIAVVCSDFTAYSSLIRRTFREYEIPVFLDYKRPASAHPLTVLINGALAAIDRGFAYEDMALYMKSGLAGLDDPEAEKLENYILAHGVRGSRWFQEFIYGSESELQEAEQLRARLISPLVKLQAGIAAGGGTYGGICLALYDFIERLNARGTLEDIARQLQSRDQMESMYMVYQGWNHLMGLLDQIQGLLGSQQAGIKEFRAVWASGLASIELGLIPTTIDQVLVGDINSSFSAGIQSVLLLGVNDGMLPAIHKNTSLLDDEDLEYLCNIGLEMDYDRQRPMARERLLIYSLINKPARFLFLSYSRADINGRALRPSLLTDRIRHLCPRLIQADDIEEPEEFSRRLLVRYGPLMRHLSSHLRLDSSKQTPDGFWISLKEYLTESSGYMQLQADKRAMELVSLALQPGSTEFRFSDDYAQLLYGSTDFTSVSRLESQAACPFAYFAAYGLNPRPRQIFTLENTDAGLIMHQVMSALSMYMRVEGLRWDELTEGAAGELAANFLEEIITSEYGELVSFSSLHRILSERLRRLGRRTAEIISWQIRQGHFIPWREELKFGDGEELPALQITTPNQRLLKLRGSIDRVDLYSQPGPDAVEYIRVIDYKTSARKLDYSLLHAGLNLQLPAYMLALLDACPGLEGAGMFYLALNDAMAKESKSSPVNDARIRSNLKMQGLFLADSSLILAMDQNISAHSKVLNARFNRDGNPVQGEGNLQPDEFMDLMAFVRERMGELGDECQDATVKAQPYRYGNKTACDYCPYPTFCRFDQGRTEGSFRRLPKLDKTGFFRIIKE